jgi:hypothetical protein
MSTLTQLRAIVKTLVQEKSPSPIISDPGDYNICIKRALQTYSQTRIPTNEKRPTFARKVVEDIAVDANGGFDTSDLTGFDVGHVDLLKIEVTIETSGQPSYISDGDWSLIDTPDGEIIRISPAPAVGETVRVTHYVAHSLPLTDDGNPDDTGDMTVPASDEDAVASESAANANRQLSNYYGAVADSATGADFVAFTSKRREYAALADMRHKEFTDFIDETKKRTRSRARTVRG